MSMPTPLKAGTNIAAIVMLLVCIAAAALAQSAPDAPQSAAEAVVSIGVAALDPAADPSAPPSMAGRPASIHHRRLTCSSLRRAIRCNILLVPNPTDRARIAARHAGISLRPRAATTAPPQEKELLRHGLLSAAIPRVSAGGLKPEITARTFPARPGCYRVKLSRTLSPPTWAGSREAHLGEPPMLTDYGFSQTRDIQGLNAVLKTGYFLASFCRHSIIGSETDEMGNAHDDLGAGR